MIAKESEKTIARACPSPLPPGEVRAKLKGWKESSGRSAYRKYLSGKKISRKEALLAHCARCMGGYADGRTDCENPMCPLYPWMPYRVEAHEEAENAPQDRPKRRRRVVLPAEG